MRSDYLDTSSHYRLLAFFQYCDCASLAVKGAAELEQQVSDPKMKAMVTALILGTRERAIQGALDLFDPYVRLGAPFLALRAKGD